MAGGYCCTFGHTCAANAGVPPTACPICGDTLLVPLATKLSSPIPQVRAAAIAAGNIPEAEAVTADVATLNYTPGPPSTRKSNSETPSFSSLVGMPAAQEPGPTLDSGDIVPFAQAAEYVPPTVPGYDILGEVGRGGMGVVYKARQRSLNRPVALKMILAGSHAGTIERERFRREAEAVATLQNPHIVQIFEIGESNGHLYLALEFVEGGNLAQHIKNAPWAAREAAELVELLARAVQYAHHQGVVHRDLKPGNVLLQGPKLEAKVDQETTKAWAAENASASSELRFPVVGYKSAKPEVRITKPVPKITDFGLAKRLNDSDNPDGGTKTGAVMGTPSYIAPEQASGKTRDVGPSVDVYALGAILYELLTGRPPFMGETALDTVLQVLHDDPVPPKRLQPTVPRDLETICLKCLTKNPSKRYLSADALGDDLRRFLQGEPIKARPLSAWGRGVKWARRHPSMAILTSFTVVATIALVSVLSVAYASVKEAVTLQEKETKAAELAREEEAKQRQRAERLAATNEATVRELARQNAKLIEESERTRRAAFALQLAQIAAMCERDPKRANELLEDPARCPVDLRDFSWAYLHRLCQREERVYREHDQGDRLQVVAYAPHASLVATAGSLGQIRVWDPRTGRTLAILEAPALPVSGLALSPDGAVVAACGSDHNIRLWVLPAAVVEESRKPAADLQAFIDQAEDPEALPPDVIVNEAHSADVTCVAFSPNGEFLVSGGEDGDLKWWSLAGWRPTNAVVSQLGGPGAAVATMRRANRDGNIVVLLREFPAHYEGADKSPRAVRSLAFAASGKVLVSGGADKFARIWAGDGSNLIASTSHRNVVRAVAVSPDGRLAATVNNDVAKTIRIIDTENGKVIRTLSGHTGQIYGLSMSPEGDLLASVGYDQTVRLWNIEDGQERGTLFGHETAVTSVAFAPDRRTVVSVSLDASARVWQTTSRPNESIDPFGSGLLFRVALSETGTAILGSDDFGRVKAARFDMLAPRPGASLGVTPFYFSTLLDQTIAPQGTGKPSKIRATATSHDGQTLLAALDTNMIAVWRTIRLPGMVSGPGPGVISQKPTFIRVPLPVFAMAVDPTGKWLATLDMEGVRLWDLKALPPTSPADDRPIDPKGDGLIYPSTGVRELVFHPAGDRLAIAVQGKQKPNSPPEFGVCLINLKGKVMTEVLDAHTAEIEAIAFGGPAGDQLATADAGGIIRVWKLVANQLKPQAKLAGHTGSVRSVAFSHDGRTLASGGADRSVILSDPVTGQERAVLTGHVDLVMRVQFLPDSSAMLTVGRDGSVKRWRAVGVGPTTGPTPNALPSVIAPTVPGSE